jgi:hypothetical protein
VVDKLNEIGTYKKRGKNQSKLPWMKLSQLKEEKRYVIKKAYKVAGTYGNQLVLETDTFRVSLPQRFGDLEEDQVDEITGLRFFFAGVENNAHIVKFE